MFVNMIMEVVSKSTHFSIYQKQSDRCFYFDLGHKEIALTLCQVLHLRRVLNELTVHENLEYMINTDGVEIVALKDKAHFILLDALHLLDLRELIQSVFSAC